MEIIQIFLKLDGLFKAKGNIPSKTKIIIISAVTVFVGFFFVHQPGAKHAVIKGISHSDKLLILKLLLLLLLFVVIKIRNNPRYQIITNDT